MVQIARWISYCLRIPILNAYTNYTFGSHVVPPPEVRTGSLNSQHTLFVSLSISAPSISK